MTSTVLVTGGLGFVGQQVLRCMEEQGLRVRLVARADKKSNANQFSNIEAVVTSRDIFAESQSWWETVCLGVDTVIHLAWYAEAKNYLQSSKNLDCTAGTIAMAKACVSANVRRFIGIGTCLEYDTRFEYLSTETPINPTTLYAASKAATFQILSKFFENEGVEFAWCRLFYLHGNSESDNEDQRRLVPYIRYKLSRGEVAQLGSGTQVRDYMNVRDASQMIVKVAVSDFQGAFNICSGNGITIRAFAEQIASEFGRQDLLNFGMRKSSMDEPPRLIGIFKPI